MTGKEIVQALRCTSTPGGQTGDCEKCPYWKTEQLTAEQKEKLGVDTWTNCDIDKVGTDAADLIERLTAENAKAEAERDALIEQIKERHDCRDCKHNDFCDFDSYTFLDCMNCVQEGCPCDGYFDSSRWEWRGLPEAASSDAEKERLTGEVEDLRRKLDMSDKDVTAAQLYFYQWQEAFNQLTQAISNIKDEDKAGKLCAALRAQLAAWGKAMEGKA